MDIEVQKLLIQRMDYLAQRWADESEYEEWSEYVNSMSSVLRSNGLSLQGMTKDPFAVKFYPKGKPNEVHTITVMRSKITMTSPAG